MKPDFINYGVIKVWIAIVAAYASVLVGLVIWITYRPQIKSVLLTVQNAMFG